MATPIVSTVIIEIVSMEIPLFICVFSFSHEYKNNTVIKRQLDSNFLIIIAFVWLLVFYNQKVYRFCRLKIETMPFVTFISNYRLFSGSFIHESGYSLHDIF